MSRDFGDLKDYNCCKEKTEIIIIKIIKHKYGRLRHQPTLLQSVRPLLALRQSSQPYSTILSKNFVEKTTKNFDKNIFQSREKIGVWKQKKWS